MLPGSPPHVPPSLFNSYTDGMCYLVHHLMSIPLCRTQQSSLVTLKGVYYPVHHHAICCTGRGVLPGSPLYDPLHPPPPSYAHHSSLVMLEVTWLTTCPSLFSQSTSQFTGYAESHLVDYLSLSLFVSTSQFTCYTVEGALSEHMWKVRVTWLTTCSLSLSEHITVYL